MAKPSKPPKAQGSTPPAKPGSTVDIGDPADKDEGPQSLRSIAGSSSRALNTVILNQVIGTLWVPSGIAAEDLNRLRQAAVLAMMEFRPADAIEGLMAAQAVGLHSAAMECLRRSMLSGQPGQASDQLRRQGANMSRAFADVLAALDRKRGKSVRQVVRVERVVVAPGGQAIIGNVQAGAAGAGQHGGGGHDAGTEEEAHAPRARLAPGADLGAVLPPLRGDDQGQDAVPVASDGERTVPDARGRQHGASD